MHNKEIAALTFKSRNNNIATPVGEKLKSGPGISLARKSWLSRRQAGEYKDDLQCNNYGMVAVIVIIQVI